jgi:DNA-binding winged helix-turn-helix (wHTH) protein
MMRGAGVFSFGPFQLDPERRRLIRAGAPVTLPDRHIDILLLLASTAGHIVSKDALIEAAWKDVAVSDNSLEQAISSLRKTLGSQQDGTPFIETLARRGYRFSATVERHQARQSDDTLDALLAPYRAFVEGRAALETPFPTSRHWRRPGIMRVKDAGSILHPARRGARSPLCCIAPAIRAKPLPRRAER